MTSDPFHVNNPATQKAMREQLARAWEDGHRHCKCRDLGMQHANPYEVDTQRPSDDDYLTALHYEVTPACGCDR